MDSVRFTETIILTRRSAPCWFLSELHLARRHRATQIFKCHNSISFSTIFLSLVIASAAEL